MLLRICEARIRCFRSQRHLLRIYKARILPVKSAQNGNVETGQKWAGTQRNTGKRKGRKEQRYGSSQKPYNKFTKQNHADDGNKSTLNI